MPRAGVTATLCVFAAALASAPAALASQGSDTVYRWDYIRYTADPGEANNLTVEDTAAGIHLNDSGAIIRWASIPGTSECAGGVHDVYCVDQAGGFEMGIDLGDGNDTLVNKATHASPEANLGPGNDKAVGGSHGYSLDGGPGADDLHGGPYNADIDGGPISQSVTYADSPGPVTVTADNAANDGTAGEGDNVHSDVHEVDGSAFGDRISGFASESGDAGNDVLIGNDASGKLYGGDGNDVLVGGAGQDTLADYSGDNTFYARDGEADQIYCGTGHDVVYADAQDVIEPPAFGNTCDDVRVG